MKKLFISLVVVTAFGVSQADAFDWNAALNFLGRAQETQTTQLQTATISDVEAKMAAIDNSVQTAFVDIVSELSGWRETRTVKSQIKSNQDLFASVITEYTNTYLENNKQNVINTIKKMSSKEKAALLNNLNTLTECGQNYLLLATNGAKTATNAFRTAQTVSEVTTTITNVNRAAAELRSRATTVMTLAKQIKAIASTAGVSVN